VPYSFENFRMDVLARIRLLNRSLSEPDDIWPGVLLLDVPDGLSAQAFDLGSAAGRHELSERQLPGLIRESRARRFCWVMPAFRDAGGLRQECLLVVIGERGRVEAALAEIHRASNAAPRLGRFSFGPFGAGARRVSGPFVDQLLAALES
jgi:hypothetical protein